MSDRNTLGNLVRKRRLESGYSLGQLASKVGKTAAEVRAWERDTELPEHGIIERLASTLEIDLGEIQKRLEEGRKALEAERKAAAAAEAAAAAIAAADETAEPETTGPDAAPVEEKATPKKATAKKPAAKKPVVEPEVVEPEAAEPTPEEQEPAEPEPEEMEADEVADEDLPGFAVEDPFTPPPPAAEEPEFDLLDAPTEAVPVPVITETATAARASRAAVSLEEPPPPPLPEIGAAPDEDPGLLRYLEPLRMLFDPDSRYLYWIRAGLTVVVMLIFAVILMSQLGNLLDAISELLDTIEPTPGNPDELNVLGLGLWI